MYYLKICETQGAFVQITDFMVLEALKLVQWNNVEAQIAFLITSQFWFPKNQIFLRPTERGFHVMVNNKETGLKWRTEAHFTKLE